MWSYIKQFFSWLLQVWAALPDKTKKEIIATAVEGLAEVFRAYYRSSQAAQTTEEPAHG